MKFSEMMKKVWAAKEGKLGILLALGGMAAMFIVGIFGEKLNIPKFIFFIPAVASMFGTRTLTGVMNLIRAENDTD